MSENEKRIDATSLLGVMAAAAVLAGTGIDAHSEPLSKGDALAARTAGLKSAANRNAAVRAALRAGNPLASNGDTDTLSDADAALVIKRTLAPDRTVRTQVTVPRLTHK